jgi:hypothetical protein
MLKENSFNTEKKKVRHVSAQRKKTLKESHKTVRFDTEKELAHMEGK